MVINLVAVVYFYIACHCLEPFIYSSFKTLTVTYHNWCNSLLVVGLCPGKVLAPGDWDNIIRNVIFRGREVKSFYDIHKSCHFGSP